MQAVHRIKRNLEGSGTRYNKKEISFKYCVITSLEWVKTVTKGYIFMDTGKWIIILIRNGETDYKDQSNFILDNLSQFKAAVITTLLVGCLLCARHCYVSFINLFIPHNNPWMCIVISLILQMNKLKHRV